MRYLILGTGALGGFYGGLLARNGCDVTFYCRSDLLHLQTHGLLVESKLGDFHLPNVQAIGESSSNQAFDVVVVCLKSVQNVHLPQLLPRFLKSDSVVVVLQNGLHVEEPTRQLVGPGKTIGGCCFLCSNKVGPGHIRHLDYGRITMGPYRGVDQTDAWRDQSRLEAIGKDFAQAGIEISLTDSLEEARWRKLMWNIPYNGLSVILDATTLDLMKHPQAAQLCESLMREVRSIAAARGMQIEEAFIEKLLEDTRKMVPYDSSMRLDFLNHRAMEIEAIFGNPLRVADAMNVPAGQLRTLYHQLRYLESRSKQKA